MTVLNQSQTRSRIVSSTSSTDSTETITERSTTSTSSSSSSSYEKQHAKACANLISNEILSMRNGQLGAKSGSCAESGGVKRIAGKEISTLFEV